jgi:hypothetical protein
MKEIIIQPDYWTGSLSLQNQTPWQVPGSVYKENELLKSDDIALEMGTGGSTLFLAARCKKVIAVETDFNWFCEVNNKIKELGIANVYLAYISKQEELEKFISDCKDAVTLFSVDTVHGYNRSRQLNAGLANKSFCLRTIILDNYAAPELFPQHWNIENILPLEKDVKIFTYDDARWCGKGTRIYSLATQTPI